jgi:multicomponent K+:H+ antiporter subunit A
MAFDLGVLTLVVGATLFILTSIAHQSVRADRETRSDD